MDADTSATITRLIQQYRQDEYIVALASDVQLSVQQVNGGYMNHVARVRTADGRMSCIAKVYMDYVKCLGPDMPIETERCHREKLTSHMFRSLAPNCCPRVYFCDEIHNIGFLEDFPAHQVWGETLLSHCDLSSGAKIVDILISIHSSTHRDKLSPPEFERLRETFRPLQQQVNFLCQAQFVQPFVASRREYKPGCLEAVRQKLEQVITDDEVIAATKCVREWMSVESGNCCIHGDLHVQNVLYRNSDGHVVLIDTEFARIGPEAYDLGFLVSNYVLIFHYHQELSLAEEEHRKPQNAKLMNDMLHLISLTLSRYMDGMSLALGDKFHKQFVWRQILNFMAVEIIGWISGPPSLDHIDEQPQVQLRCLQSGLSILQIMPTDTTQLVRILHNHI